MRVPVADIGHVAVSSPSVAWGGLSCPAEQQPAQRDQGWSWSLLSCSPAPLHHPLMAFPFSTRSEARACARARAPEGPKEVKGSRCCCSTETRIRQRINGTLWHMWTRIIVTSSDLHQKSRPPASQPARHAGARRDNLAVSQAVFIADVTSALFFMPPWQSLAGSRFTHSCSRLEAAAFLEIIISNTKPKHSNANTFFYKMCL